MRQHTRAARAIGGLPGVFGAACAAGAGLLALLVLLSWALGAWRLGALGADYVPMSPSTAWPMLALSCAVLARILRPASAAARRLAWLAAGLAVAMALLAWARLLFGVELPVENWLAPASDSVGGVPVGRMSPLTAAVLPLLALAVVFDLPPFTRLRWRRQAAAVLAAGVVLACLAVLFSYLAGAPLMYSGQSVPMALATAVACLLLGGAVLSVAGPGAWPASLARAALGDPASGSRRSTAWRTLAAFAFFVLAVGTAGVFYIRQTLDASRQDAQSDLSAIADLKVGQISDWYHERRSDAELIASTRVVQALAVQFLAGLQQNQAAQEMTEWMVNLYRLRGYEQLALYDAQGALRLSWPEGGAVADMSGYPGFEAAMRATGVVAMDLHRDLFGPADSATGIHLSFWVPVRDTCCVSAC